MISFNPKEPDSITLVTTFRCNASCERCCFGCRPDFGRTMTIEQMKRYVDISLEAYPNFIKYLSLTGGECFLLGKDLDGIISFGKEKGLRVGLISNGYWGYNYKEAVKRINGLKELGLAEISFTCGDEHNHLIPFRSVRNAVVASARAGFKVEFRTENGYYNGIRAYIEKDAVLQRLIENKKITRVSQMFVDFNNEKTYRRHPESRYRYPEKSKPCRSLCHSITISPYGDVMACCGIGMFRIPQLRLGNIETEPIKTIFNRIFQDALKIWLHTGGPIEIFQYLYDKSDISFRTWGEACRFCKEIFSNPEIIPFLKEHYEDWIEKIHYY